MNGLGDGPLQVIIRSWMRSPLDEIYVIIRNNLRDLLPWSAFCHLRMWREFYLQSGKWIFARYCICWPLSWASSLWNCEDKHSCLSHSMLVFSLIVVQMYQIAAPCCKHATQTDIEAGLGTSNMGDSKNLSQFSFSLSDILESRCSWKADVCNLPSLSVYEVMGIWRKMRDWVLSLVRSSGLGCPQRMGKSGSWGRTYCKGRVHLDLLAGISPVLGWSGERQTQVAI